MIFIPTILESTVDNFAKKLALLPPDISRIQVDLIEDGFSHVGQASFDTAQEPSLSTTTTTLNPQSWPKEISRFEVEAHLMVANPFDYLHPSISSGAKTLICQIENLGNNQALWVSTVHGQNKKVGLAIDLPTSLDALDKNLLSSVDQMLLLAVVAGKSGQTFDPRVLLKIQELRKMAGEKLEIIIDGGINDQTALLCKNAGASGVAVNSWLWQDFSSRWQQLQNIQ